MRLNETETQMLYNVLWAIGNNWITPEDIVDDENSPEDYKNLWEKIKAETDLGWASSVNLEITHC